MQVQLDAVLKDALGDLIQNATVAFSYKLSAGSSFTSAGTGVTDSTGLASVVVDLAAGVYDLMAGFNGSATLLKSSVEITYDASTQAQTQLTETVSPPSPAPTQEIVVSGALSANGTGVSGAQVDVVLNGSPIGSVPTESGGSYSAQFGPLKPGTYALTVSYAGSAAYLPASHQLTFKVLGGGGIGPLGVAVVAVSAAVVGTALVVERRRHRR